MQLVLQVENNDITIKDTTARKDNDNHIGVLAMPLPSGLDWPDVVCIALDRPAAGKLSTGRRQTWRRLSQGQICWEFPDKCESWEGSSLGMLCSPYCVS